MSSLDSPHIFPRASSSNDPLHPIVIVGAGLIGLSIALELHNRGVAASVLEKGSALRQASIAAAGMLSAEDPHNPPQLLDLARYSRSLYPAFLARIEALSGFTVPLQTSSAVQYLASGETIHLDETSLDPRQLTAALLAAIRVAGIDLRENQAPPPQDQLRGRTVVIAAGTWSDTPLCPVTPRKGQMLRVALPPSLRDLNEVHRSRNIYIVPRTLGPQAGSALIGATVEDAGFDTTVRYADLEHLRKLAAQVLPALASEIDAPTLESWAGLRPATPDGLPILGSSDSSINRNAHSAFIATGHFRNGILLAPATAAVVADLIERRQPAVNLSAFAPQRFAG